MPIVWSSDFNAMGILIMVDVKAFPCCALDQGWKIGQEAPLWNIIHIPNFYCTQKYSGLFPKKTKFFSPPNCKDQILLALSFLSYPVMARLPPSIHEVSQLLSSLHVRLETRNSRYLLTPSGNSYQPENLSAFAKPL